MAETPNPENAGKAAKGAGKGAASWMKGDMFGMPRWAWFGLLAGGLALGLYLRARSAAQEAAIEEEAAGGELDAPLALSPEADFSNAAAMTPGLAGVGVLGPPGGMVHPVTTPIIPEALTDLLGVLGGGTTDFATAIGEALADNLPAAWRVTEDQWQRDPPGTGGGPPNRRRGNHQPLILTKKTYQSQLEKLARGGKKDQAGGGITGWERKIIRGFRKSAAKVQQGDYSQAEKARAQKRVKRARRKAERT